MDYETVVGLEVHSQLLTKSKMFCRCSASYQDAEPNTYVCPVCLGMPGVLPVINQQALEYTIMTALALNCTIPEHSKFDRKNYPYPDLVKGYQISQYDAPLSVNGWIDIDVDGQSKRIGITRVHLEEDTAKLLHRSTAEGEAYSLVDVNRSGVPLMEIVSEPDMRSPEEARQYLIKLRSILQYLGVSTGNMEEGSFRCDANISVRPVGHSISGVKVEVKNMNSFRAVYRALQYEETRQREVVQADGRLAQETRGWIEDRGVTVSQRSKEYAHDYRYFPEPDLPPLAVSRELVDKIRTSLPELPDAKRDRFMQQYGLSLYDASLLTGSRATADYFEQCVSLAEGEALTKTAKTVSNWLLGDFTRLLHATSTEIGDARVTPKHLMEMLDLIEAGTLSGAAAKTVLDDMFKTGKHANDIIRDRGLTQISNTEEVDGIVTQVIADNAKAVEDFQKGKEQALKFLVGQVMRLTKGRANPELVAQLLKERLQG
ncbi:MAG: Asp-tRNA(Asn)/Glu-tRNA(Gln) amidotransferase subunit GatB [Chloroflexota bacterium]|nr:Asp-tRNA(Asn)/Glu-tRNA(Gln) amidotransferase subunit GatB [Chloroflexota bacterium]